MSFRDLCRVTVTLEGKGLDHPSLPAGAYARANAICAKLHEMFPEASVLVTFTYYDDVTVTPATGTVTFATGTKSNPITLDELDQ